MATLSITKYSNKVWKFIASDVSADFSFSKLQVDTDGDSFVIVSQGGATTNSYQLADITVYASEGGTPETGWLSMEALLLRLEELNFPAWNESGAVLDFNLRVQQEGETVISNVNKLIFDGATVVNNGDDSVTITITGGGGGVTEFTELTDVPASYTGQASKVVAVKADETGLEFVASVGSQDLQDTLDIGKTATFTDPQDALTEINLGEYNEMDLDSHIYFRQSRTFEDVEQITSIHQSLGVVEFSTYIYDLLTGIGRYGSMYSSNGDVRMYTQNQFTTFSKEQSFGFENEIVEPSENLEIFYKPNPKYVSGTYYLATLDDITGVTEFTELTDVPASYTGQGSKVVAVKADETGLEFVAGVGSQDLQSVTDEGNTTTNGISVQSLIIQGGDPPIDPVDAEMSIITYSDDIENVLAFLWADNMMVFIKDKAEVGGTYRMRGTGVDTEETIAFLSDIAGGGAVDSVNGQTGVVVLDSDDISEGATNLYFTDARALGAIPDATASVKGIAKLYTSLGSNTDGAVDQNTVNTALALKANAPLIDTISSSPITGVTTEGILKSYLIPANTYTASEILNFANDLYKTGTAGTVTSRLYTNTTASLSGAILLATNISTAGNRKVPLRRQLVLKGGNIEVIAAIGSLPDDNLNSSSVATLVTFNPAVDNYFITTAQNASAGDSTLQNNLKIHF